MASERDDQAPPPASREPLRRVGIRQLKAQTSEVVRRVREDHETVEITLRGEVVARIVPVDAADTSADIRAAREEQGQALRAKILRAGETGEGGSVPGWTQADREAALERAAQRRIMGQEISRNWPKGLSAVDAIRDVRDDGW